MNERRPLAVCVFLAAFGVFYSGGWASLIAVVIFVFVGILLARATEPVWGRLIPQRIPWKRFIPRFTPREDPGDPRIQALRAARMCMHPWEYQRWRQAGTIRRIFLGRSRI